MASIAHVSVLLLAAMSISLMARPSNAGGGSASVKHWLKALPNVPLPLRLRERVSPLDSSEVARYASELAASSWSSSAATGLCKAGHLYCNSEEFAAFRAAVSSCGIQVRFRTTSHDARQQQGTSAGGAVSFFKESALVEGARVTLGDQRSRVPTPAFLPRGLASQLLHGTQLTQLGIPASSLLAQEMAGTSKLCELDPNERLDGEDAFCVHSLEDLSDKLKPLLSSPKTSLRLLPVSSTSSAAVSGKLVSVRREVESGGAYLACHAQTYPFAVHFCHHVPRTRVYSAIVRTDAGEAVHAVGICHLDTSQWSPLHVAFADLHSTPGHTDACHWTHEDALVFVTRPAST